MKTNFGFTLIEVLTYIAICSMTMTVLMALAFTMYQSIYSSSDTVYETLQTLQEHPLP